jgi:CBS domain-containing protein
MEQYKITRLPVADGSGKLVGALNIDDLFRSGAV